MDVEIIFPIGTKVRYRYGNGRPSRQVDTVLMAEVIDGRDYYALTSRVGLLVGSSLIAADDVSLEYDFTDLPLYKAHKTVGALKIASVDTGVFGTTLTFEDDNYAPRAYTAQQLEKKPTPEVGGYLVEYMNKDGDEPYFSFSPAEPFDDGYSPMPTPPYGKRSE